MAGFELDSEEFESWRRAERSQYLEQSIDLLSRLMKLLMESGQSEHAIETGTRILRLDPLHESTARHMMQLYASSGRRGTAIQLYRTLSEALLKDVNTQPEAETRQVFAAIAQANDSEPVSPAPPRDPMENPSNVPSPAAAQRSRAPVMAWASACMIVIALASMWWIQQAPGTAAAPAGPITAAPVTVAVLPFSNLSDDPAQQFFSDGMTEEISNALAKIPRNLFRPAPASRCGIVAMNATWPAR
jgi:tetratricopeptide (TPR) repeat protein